MYAHPAQTNTAWFPKSCGRSRCPPEFRRSGFVVLPGSMFYMPAPDRNSRSPDHRIASDRATSQRALKEAGGGRIDPGCGRRLPKIDDARPDPADSGGNPEFRRKSRGFRRKSRNPAKKKCHICVIFVSYRVLSYLCQIVVLPCVLPQNMKFDKRC